MKKNKNENYLIKIPCRKEGLNWTKNDKDQVTLEIENKGIFNRLFQLILKKPKISYIHLDETGSFVWPLIDGESDVFAIGKKVKEEFGEKADPLYPRLVLFFETLDKYKFITFKK